MDLGFIYIDLLGVIQFFTQPIGSILVQLFVLGGWLVLVYLILFVAIQFYVDYRQDKATKDWEWVVLAVDIPAVNIQTPVAVEQMFSHLAGAYDDISFESKFFGGHKQRVFSFEIISIEGYIQFLIRTEKAMEDLVKAALYAQYPAAAIVEVEDYTLDFPSSFPNDKYDIWGADFGLAENEAFPIRTHTEFEHNISEDEIIKDPMGAFLESFSRIGKGEQMWYQMILQPINSSWKQKSIDLVKEIMGEKAPPGDHVGDKLVAGINKSLESLGDQIFGREAAESSGDFDKPDRPVITPGQRKVLEGVEDKIAKTGFKTKIRAIYLAEKEVFKPTKGVNALIGAINQFNNPSSNSLVPKFTTGSAYFFKDKKSNKKKSLMISSYKKRKPSAGATPYILNVEELATLWHFPMSTVLTPLLQKSDGKRAEPPSGLPIDPSEDVIGAPVKSDAPDEPKEEMRFG